MITNPSYGQTVSNFKKEQNGRIISLDIVSEPGNLSAIFMLQTLCNSRMNFCIS